MPHATLKTATGTTVNHSLKYPGQEFTDTEKQQLQEQYLNSYPGISPTYYTKLDLNQVELLPTKEYNCWGFTFDPRRCVINTGADVENILNDNASAVPDGSVKCGDVICYRLNGMITHTGRVWSVDNQGHATLIRSKWGQLGEYLHPPPTVPPIYGTEITYWKMHTHLQGRAVLFIKDSNSDTGFDCSPVPFWVSPDIWVDSDLDGNPDPNPIANQVNHVYARVRNNGTEAISNTEIRFYWADPSGGIPPSAWNLIGTFPIAFLAANSDVLAGPVSWTPQATPEHQCLLVIANGGDGVAADNEPDPIVYTFDVRWENCIGMRNVFVETKTMGSSFSVDFKITNIKLEPAVLNIVVEEIGEGIEGPKQRKGPERELGIQLIQDIEFEQFKSEGALICQFRGIELKPEESRELEFKITIPPDAKPGDEYVYHMIQKIDDEVTGGVTYIVRVVEEKTQLE